jgi:hypothetical protein
MAQLQITPNPHQIIPKTVLEKTLLLTGQFDPEFAGHFDPELTGHFSRKFQPVYEMRPLMEQFREVYLLRNKVHRDISTKSDSCSSDRVSLAFRSYHFLAGYVQKTRMYLLTHELGTEEKAKQVYEDALRAIA